MINGSTAFNNAVIEGGHPYTARISENGTIISCDVISCTITKGSTGNEAFSVGNCFVPYIQMEVRELNTSLENKELKLEVGVYTDSTTIEWISIGYFKVTSVQSSTVKTTFTALGRLATLLPLVQPTISSTTISSVISAVQTAVRAYDAAYSSFTIDTSAVDITGGEITESLDGLNARQLLEIIAGCVGAYLTEDNLGNIVLFKYDSSAAVVYDTGSDGNITISQFSSSAINATDPNSDGNIVITNSSSLPVASDNDGVIDMFTYNTPYVVDGDRMIQHPTFSDYNFSLTNIKVIQQEEYELDDGTVVPEVSYIYDDTATYNWVVSNKYMASQSMFNVFCTNCLGLVYRPATVELAYGDPRLEATDLIEVIDTNNIHYAVPALSLTHVITGGLKTTIVAPGASETELETGFKGPLTQQLDIISSSAQTARVAAAQAQADALDAQASAQIAQASAESAQADATLAQTSAQIAQESAESAQADANTALANAQASTQYANNALGQLGEIEKVVDALNWISEHGQYSVTDDTEVVAGKWYFELVNGEYIIVTPADSANPHDLGYYELTSVDSAISNYVSTHLALTDDGLYVQMDDTACKMQITSSAINLYDSAGAIIATYSSSVILGNPDGIHIHLSPTDGLGFYQGTEDSNNASVNRVAYINGNKLYISQAEITTSLRIGQFVWKVQSANRISLVYAP